jgi:hypothetical protein
MLIIGSTCPAYPLKPEIINWTPEQVKAGGKPTSTRIINGQGVKAIFINERFKRLTVGLQSAVGNTEDELLQRFRLTDQNYMLPISMLEPDAPGLSRASVNFYIRQRKRTTSDWKMFNHQNQSATSFFVVRSFQFPATCV